MKSVPAEFCVRGYSLAVPGAAYVQCLPRSVVIIGIFHSAASPALNFAAGNVSVCALMDVHIAAARINESFCNICEEISVWAIPDQVRI